MAAQTFTVECSTGSPPILDDWLKHIVNLVATLICIGFIDQLSMRRFFPGDQKTRWFALHFLVNAIICVAAFHDLVHVARRPLCVAIEATASWVPSYCAWSLHLYHLLAFTSLRKEDVVHHVLFAGVLGIFNFTINWGRFTNLLIFFMTGLPGGVDYAMLVLVKTGRIQRIHQKSICSAINTWIRVPGHVGVASLMASCVKHGVISAPAWVVSIVASLTLLNGLYYGEQAIGTFHRLAALSPTHKDKTDFAIAREAVTS